MIIRSKLQIFIAIPGFYEYELNYSAQKKRVEQEYLFTKSNSGKNLCQCKIKSDGCV